MATLCPLYKNNYTIAIITIFFFHLVYYSVTASTSINNNGGFSAHLIRRNSPNSPFYNHKTNKVFRRLMDPDTAGSTLLTDSGYGFNMKFSMGTPPSDIYAAADTGSDLIWTQCQPCQACYETKYALFDSRNSSTYRNITCSARECRLLGDARPPNYSPNICRKFPEGNCDYRVTYADKASSTGVLAKETITLTSKTGKIVTLKDIVFGCGFLNDAGPVGATGNQMGVIGLGKGPLSFVSQIAPHVGGKRFSYCLVPLDTDPSTKSQINFGNGSEVLGEGVVSTPLVDIEGESYVVAVEGITIGNEFVPFNSSKTLANKLNMIVDSGSTLGDVPRDIFDRVVTQLNKTLDPELEPYIYTDSEDNSTSLCLNSTTIPNEPKVAIHFEGGGKVELMAEQIFFRLKNELVCFGMQSTSDLGNIYGAIFQENFLVGFDLDRKVVSFKPTNCLNY